MERKRGWQDIFIDLEAIEIRFDSTDGPRQLRFTCFQIEFDTELIHSDPVSSIQRRVRTLNNTSAKKKWGWVDVSSILEAIKNRFYSTWHRCEPQSISTPRNKLIFGKKKKINDNSN